MIEFIKKEPVVVLTVVEYAIITAVAFGLPITTEQKLAVIGLAASVLTIVTRQMVTPNVKVTK